jgi:sulfite reductase (NADPH) flavoprotein alpha-component
MLSETKYLLLQQLVKNASNEEIIWTKGYLAGYLDKNDIAVQTPVKAAEVGVKPLILYGTETGNSKKVASQLLTTFKKNKIQAKAVDVFQYDLSKLEKEALVIFVISTQGEGEFPQNAQPFYEKLLSSTASLDKVSFAVFGLGDSSYPLFCNAGVLLDEVLEAKGAKRLLPLVKSDVDYADDVIQWETDLQKVFQNQQVTPSEIVKTVAATGHKKNYTGQISHKIVLNDRGSNKETYHIEITSEDEIVYEPGDALGVIPKNDDLVVEQILAYFKEEGNREITIKEQKNTLSLWLKTLNVKGLSKRSIAQISELLETSITLEKADLIDILTSVPKPNELKIEQIIGLLLPIAPRLYSISSAAAAHDGQVHLTVNLNQFTVDGQIKTGLASQFLAEYPKDMELEFYIHKNQNFRLPSDEKDIIMIGPGTGIAPFRSFLAHRDATGAEGKNWLFFGEQHFVSDFYYQTEIQEWLATGLLNQFDVAFSRDQKEKIYVQDRIAEKANEFNKWLENGASLYVCGQKNPMSTDVENTIVEVIASQRNISSTQARQVLEQLEIEGRYQKDVY